MANYLLLRDNKETGPYSLNELLDLGLKTYDLVWIQGKSAAWRYPSEVEELKAFAPVAEEQPFDRFFKKKTEYPVPVPSFEKNEQMAFKKNVYVTMPIPKNEVTETGTTATSQSGNSYQRVKTIIVTENPVAAEMKYSQPLDEIKEMYVKTLQQRKQKIARKNLFFKTLKRASVFIYVLALGVLIGFTLKSKTLKKNIAVQPTNAMQSSSPVQTSPSPTNPELPTQQQQITANTEQQEPIIEIRKSSKAIPEKTPIQKTKSNTKKENTSVATTKKENSVEQNPPGIDVNAVTGERNKKSRNSSDEETTTSSSREDISKLVSVKSNDYKRGAFGGIRDLQLTVTNDSKYILDNVVVALQYLKPSEQPLKTENISFQSIAPKGTMTIAIPPSNRGIKVAFKIVKIESKELNNETAGL
jgi:hypothetical protein